MRILQATTAFYPALAYGGTVVASYQISKFLCRSGHFVTAYTSDAFNETKRQVNKIAIVDNLKIYYFKNLSNRLAWHRLFFNPGIILFIIKNINKFDIIHIHDYRSFQTVIIHYFAKKNKIPYVLQAHGSLPLSNGRNKIKRLYNLFWGYSILRGASRVIALTKTEEEQYIKMGVDKEKIEIVPNGVDLSEYEILPERGEFKRKYGLKNDEKMILYAGRLNVTKGIDLLIEAFAETLNKLDNIRLVLLGPDDGYRSSLESLVQTLNLRDKVIFTGFVSTNEKIMAYVDANVFVTPKFSGFPITFLESCACGTPIITTNNGDELDWINNNVGYVVRYDKDKLRDAITYILKNEDVRERFGQEGIKLIKEKFNWEKIVEHMEDVYEKCAPKNRI